MLERDWQHDWDWVNNPDVCLSERVREMFVYYLQQVRELEAQVRELEEENARWRERSKKLLTIANELLAALEKEDD